MKQLITGTLLAAMMALAGCQKKQEPQQTWSYDSNDTTSQPGYDDSMDTAVVDEGPAVYEEPAPDPMAGQTYVVQKGDTLYGISKKFYGTGTRVRDIAAANGLADPNKIFVGQELVIP